MRRAYSLWQTGDLGDDAQGLHKLLAGTRCRASCASRTDVRASLSVGAAMPLLIVVVSSAGALVPIVSGASLVFLALLGAIGARAGGVQTFCGLRPE